MPKLHPSFHLHSQSIFWTRIPRKSWIGSTPEPLCHGRLGVQEDHQKSLAPRRVDQTEQDTRCIARKMHGEEERIRPILAVNHPDGKHELLVNPRPQATWQPASHTGPKPLRTGSWTYRSMPQQTLPKSRSVAPRLQSIPRPTKFQNRSDNSKLAFKDSSSSSDDDTSSRKASTPSSEILLL